MLVPACGGAVSASPADSTVLVTGGLGRLGRYVVDAVRRNHRVIVVDRDARCGDQDVRAADVCDYPALRDAMRDASRLIHLAGIDASVRIDASETFRVNTLGAWNAFRAAEELGYRKVVFCSSVAVHGLY
jgi:UDP-glucose 4-epimerase